MSSPPYAPPLDSLEFIDPNIGAPPAYGDNSDTITLSGEAAAAINRGADGSLRLVFEHESFRETRVFTAGPQPKILYTISTRGEVYNNIRSIVIHVKDSHNNVSNGHHLHDYLF